MSDARLPATGHSAQVLCWFAARDAGRRIFSGKCGENLAFLAFLPVLREQAKTSPVRRLSTLNGDFFGFRAGKLDHFNGARGGGAAELIFRPRREQKGELPPCFHLPRLARIEQAGCFLATRQSPPPWPYCPVRQAATTLNPQAPYPPPRAP